MLAIFTLITRLLVSFGYNAAKFVAGGCCGTRGIRGCSIHILRQLQNPLRQTSWILLITHNAFKTFSIIVSLLFEPQPLIKPTTIIIITTTAFSNILLFCFNTIHSPYYKRLNDSSSLLLSSTITTLLLASTVLPCITSS